MNKKHDIEHSLSTIKGDPVIKARCKLCNEVRVASVETASVDVAVQTAKRMFTAECSGKGVTK